MEDREVLAVKLAGMEQECDVIGGCTYREDGGECGRCHRTGKVYVFDGSVRELCPIDSHHGPGCLCAGRDWTPSMEREVWCQALQAANFDVVIVWQAVSRRGASVIVDVVDVSGGQQQLVEDAEAMLTALAQKAAIVGYEGGAGYKVQE